MHGCGKAMSEGTDGPRNSRPLAATIVFLRHPSVRNSGANMAHVHSRQRRREIVRMSFTTPPHNEGYASYLAAMQLEPVTALWDEADRLPALELLKSLDDLDEEEDEDDDKEDEDIDDLDDEEDEDDLDEDYEDDEDEDEDDDEDEDEEDDEDGGVRPLKMA
jgi:hypothetical protein